MNFNLAAMERRIWSAFFRTESNLFYDYRTRDGLDDLPSPGEIAQNFPNGCGWGTGMEDGMLHAGSMLDVLCRRGDRERAERVLDGIDRCSGVPGNPGFVVRAVSPADGRSCYVNSSRDQFTLAVFGAWCFRRAFPDSGRAAEILERIARYCAAHVGPENGYNLLRLDGRPGVVSRIWDCEAHEALRLAMFYAAAEDLSRARRYFEPGLAQTLAMDPQHPWWDIELVQMQFSLALLDRSGLFVHARADLRRAMRMTAGLSLAKLEESLAAAETFDGDWGAVNRNWRELPFFIVPETLREHPHEARFGGITYLSPRYPAEYQTVFGLLRGIGNYLSAILYAPGIELPSGVAERVARILQSIDFDRVASGGIIQLYHGVFLLDQKQKGLLK